MRRLAAACVAIGAAACGDNLTSGPTGPQLLSVEPAFARPGQTIQLEGTFGAGATVRFPSGERVDATVLGPHRASVVVPANASVGALTVQTGGVEVGPVAFRAAPFAIELGSFRADDEQTDAARTLPSLVQAREDHTAVVLGSWLYVLGGTGTNGVVLASVERARINADGTLGPFATANDSPLGTPREGAATARIGDWLYVFGGRNGESLSDAAFLFDTVERAPIAADGSLGAFAPVDTTLARARTEHDAAVVGNAVYLVGGFESAIERAPVYADGSLGPFALLDDVHIESGGMDVHRVSARTIVAGNSLLVLGGSLLLADVPGAPIDGNGDVAPFAPTGRSLTMPRTAAAGAYLGATIYLIGGFGGTAVDGLSLVGSVERTTLAANTLGPFAPSARGGLTMPRMFAGSGTVGNWLYVVGGTAGEAEVKLGTVERAPLGAGSALGEFTAAPAALRAPRAHHATAVIGDAVYLLGGDPKSTATAGTSERAPLAADGTLGAFVPGPALDQPRGDAAAAMIGESLYLIGGDGGAGPLATISRASIADGTVAPFAAVRATLTTPRTQTRAVAFGGALYAIGGRGPAGALASIERAPIANAAIGNLGAFADAGTALLGPRTCHAVAVLGGQVYVLGGATDTDTLASIESAPIAADGTLGTFIAAGELRQPRCGASVAVVGDWLYVFGGVDADRQPVTEVERAEIRAAGRLGPFAPVTYTAIPRAFGSALVAGDALLLIGGDDAGTIERAPLE